MSYNVIEEIIFAKSSNQIQQKECVYAGVRGRNVTTKPDVAYNMSYIYTGLVDNQTRTAAAAAAALVLNLVRPYMYWTPSYTIPIRLSAKYGILLTVSAGRQVKVLDLARSNGQTHWTGAPARCLPFTPRTTHTSRALPITMRICLARLAVLGHGQGLLRLPSALHAFVCSMLRHWGQGDHCGAHKKSNALCMPANHSPPPNTRTHARTH
eukprot:SAG31_NODE_3043_length_4753_cov_3.006016_1_plen_209_part_10